MLAEDLTQPLIEVLRRHCPHVDHIPVNVYLPMLIHRQVIQSLDPSVTTTIGKVLTVARDNVVVHIHELPVHQLSANKN